MAKAAGKNQVVKPDYGKWAGDCMSDIFNNELFEAFASASDNVYIYVCDMKTDISRWSKAAVNYFGLEGEYLEDAANVWGQHVHPDDLKVYMEDIAGVFSGKKKYHNCQYRARNALGKYVWVECKGSVIWDAEGSPIIFAGLMTRIDGQSKYDSLTGLLTTQEMHYFDFAFQSGIALLIGMDGFRKTISNYGYNIGDELLISFAREIGDLCKPEWKALRFSGDEFLVIAFASNLQEVTDFYEEHELSVVKRVKGNMGDRTQAFRFRLTLTASGPAGLPDEIVLGRYTDDQLTGTETVKLTDGACEFELSHGDRISVVLPYGTEYEVTELNGEELGYAVSSLSATSTVTDHNIAVEFTNTKNGGIPTGFGAYTAIALMFITVSGMIVLLLIRRRKK